MSAVMNHAVITYLLRHSISNNYKGM